LYLGLSGAMPTAKNQLRDFSIPTKDCQENRFEGMPRNWLRPRVSAWEGKQLRIAWLDDQPLSS